MTMRIGALILAAGYSRRFGAADKRLYEIETNGRSRPMIVHTLAKYLEVFADVTVVVRDDDGLLKALLKNAFRKEKLEKRNSDQKLRLVETDAAHLGMGHSLAAGILGLRDVDGLFIGLADMPFVQTQTLAELRDTLDRAIASAGDRAMVQPKLDDRPGNPVGFGNGWFDVLARATGDQGARTVLEANRDRIVYRPVTDPGVLQDIDQPAD